MSNFILRIITSVILISIIYLSLQNIFILFIVLFLISYFSTIEYNLIVNKIFKNKSLFYFFSINVFIIYISIFSVSIWMFLNSANHIAIVAFVFLILICTSTDIGGYLFGKTIGGKKLTKISPNKTYSGVIGSYLISILCGFVYSLFFSKY